MANYKVFDDLLQKMQRVNVESFVEEAVEENKNVLEDMNVEQMYSGIRSDGTAIEPYYKPATIERKKKYGQKYSVVTLRDTRDFHNSVEALNTYQSSVLMVATDAKTTALQEKYGAEILGITDGNIERFRGVIKPSIIEQTKQFMLNG